MRRQKGGVHSAGLKRNVRLIMQDIGVTVAPDTYFGCNVFNENVMRNCLQKKVFEAVMATRKMGTPLPKDAADSVANAMREWAVANGCTHFTHWFQPMTGVTAEKHDAFIIPAEGGVILLLSMEERE